MSGSQLNGSILTHDFGHNSAIAPIIRSDETRNELFDPHTRRYIFPAAGPGGLVKVERNVNNEKYP